MKHLRTLLEVCPTNVTVLDEKKDASGDTTLKVLVKWQQVERLNGNKRRYSKALLEREIAKLAPRIEEGEIWGSTFHPEDGVGTVDDISHQWTKIWMNEKGECMGEVEVLPTTRGANLQKILKRGKVGLSSRGKGTLSHKKEDVNGVEEEFDDVNDDFNLLSPGDFVLGQSVSDAGPIKILESKLNESIDLLEKEENAKVDKFKTIEELKAAYPEFAKQIEEAAVTAALAEEKLDERIAAALKEEKTKWDEGVTKEIEESIKVIEEDRTQIVETLREVMIAISEIEGVVPEDDAEVVEGEGDGAVVKEADAPAAPAEAGLKAEIAKLKAEIAKLKAALDGNEEKAVAAETQKTLKTSFDTLLKEEAYSKFSTTLTEELVVDGKFVATDAADLKKKADAVVAKSQRIIAEAVKNKIVAGGIAPKGITESQVAAEDTRRKDEAFEKEARAAGFTGKL